MLGSFCISIVIKFSHISHRMDAVNQVSSGEDAAIGLARFSSLEEKSRKC